MAYENADPLITAKNGGELASVSTTSVLLAASNVNRRNITIQNLSLLGMLTLSFGKAAVTQVGLNLAPASDAKTPGGDITILGTTFTGAIYGILSDADATANVSIVEF